MTDPVKALVAALAAAELRRPVLLVVESDRRAEELLEPLALFRARRQRTGRASRVASGAGRVAGTGRRPASGNSRDPRRLALALHQRTGAR